LKLYYPKSHYSKAHRGLLFPLLKPFLKAEGYTDAERMATYGVSETDFEFTECLEEADVVILTMAWNYYVKIKQESLAIAFVNECGALNKKVIAFNAGDFGVKTPYFENLKILRLGGYKSKFSKNEFVLPPFISDPLKKYYQRNELFLRPYRPKPVIGFCGQANHAVWNAVKEIGSIFLRNSKTYLGSSNEESQQLLSTSYLRASLLNGLRKVDGLSTNFILRKKYRAGVKENKDTHQTTLEFYDNLRDSDYVLCVRGAGNFSMRFYEALAMGRIPILINTDCALPLEDAIDWKKHVVWVEYGNRQKVAEKVSEFHKSLSAQDFLDFQKTNRKLWKEHLTLNGFFHIFINSTDLV
jgi:hypothetical protein